jgi:predicted AlkP superfamily pyrophosphatase or phosphodiesterase
MLVSTFGDELAIASAGRAKVFGVSVKDRGAVSLAGHAGKAFWFSKATGSFVTSDYYYNEYPDWVSSWNAKRLADAYAETSWDLLQPRGDYLFGAADDRPWEIDLAGFGRTFPHPYGAADGPYYTALLTVSPAGDELTLDFAKTLIDAEELGQDATPDYLAVSFSSTDYVGHLFGPSSLEGEDMILRLDRMLAELLRFVDERVGLENTLIVLSADHGGPDAPGFLGELGIDAGYASFPEGAGDGLIEAYEHPYVYLDRTVVRTRELDLEEAARRVADELEAYPDIARAVSIPALRAGFLAHTDLHQAVAHNDHHGRSGDIYVAFEAQRFINDFDGLEVASTHGSPWSYDTFVPIFFLGPDVPAQNVYRRVHTVDIAPTLAAYLRIKPPSGSRAEPLVEVLRGR